MSQKASRKGVVNEEKEKTDTPVKDMKKKMAANAEKEKLTAEKKDAEKPAEKPVDKAAEEVAEKGEKSAEKKSDKPTEKKVDKVAEKKAEKSAEKKADAPAEKKEDSNKDDKSGKSEKPDQKKSERPKLNGKDTRVTNGTNGDENGTVSGADEDDDAMLVIEEGDHDEMFPELTYDDTSDPEFEPADAPHSRSFTRRSQAKVTRTPETPRPASDKQPEKEAADESKDSKVLKLKEDAPPSTDRKLRSADSPKPQEKKQDKLDVKKTDSPKKDKDGKQESEMRDQEEKENGDKSEKEADVVIEIDAGDDEPRKTDTNYSKSRVKVSPYRRSMRIADQTTSSVMANYTGNNTTMEMDITETTSSFMSEDPSLDDSSYLSGLRSIRGRRSYKPLKEMTLRHVVNKSQTRSVNVSAGEQPSRPTAPVVGRKRKPEGDDSANEAGSDTSEAHTKRMRLLDRLAHSFRRTASSTPLPQRRAAEIVGINTDLPLSAPIAQADTFDPEALKPAEAPIAVPLAPAAAASPLASPLEADRDSKRCIVM